MLSNALISQLGTHLLTHTGLLFSEKRWDEIRQKMTAAMKDFDFEDVEKFIHWLLSAPLTKHQIEILACHLTVQETYFFRESKTFEVLEQTILPKLINSRRNTEKRIRIWSAGCSAGEEPYSIAILLNKLIPDIKDWSITILATDINPVALQKARQGLYTEWSFRDTPQWVNEKYFEKIKQGHYAIRSPIKEMVNFSYLNLSEDNYPSLSNNTNAIDLIFCRNVLMYFAPETVLSVIARFNRSLLNGGFLIVSVVEISSLFSSEFNPVRFKDITLYNKDGNYPKQIKAIHPPPPLTKSWPEEFEDEIKPPKLSGKTHIKKANVKNNIKTKLTPYEEAAALYGQGQYREAEDKLTGILAGNHDNPKVIILFARILANQGKLADALHWCEKAISVDKLNPGLYYLRATILEELGNTVNAMTSLNEALYLDHEFVLAHFALGNLAMRLGKHAESKKHLRNTMELLSRYKPDEVLPESEGITTGRLTEMLLLTNP
jgi:chemotaxis protein methyltransferase CheR